MSHTEEKLKIKSSESIEAISDKESVKKKKQKNKNKQTNKQNSISS